MDFLVLAPPVCTPSEPPSGAFLLAAGLRGRGFEVGFFDLSLELFHRMFETSGSAVQGAIDYLLRSPQGYTPQHHRSAAGHLHGALKLFNEHHPGWKLSLMDLAPPGRVHNPSEIAEILRGGPSPFESLWEEVLLPKITRLRPAKVLVSLAYLSQLPAGIDLVRFLSRRGIPSIVGGSLPTSLAATGRGFDSLKGVFPDMLAGDGMALLEGDSQEHMLDRLAWPFMVSARPYLSSRPFVPLSLSSGCFWNRCLFCPDRELPYFPVSIDGIEQLMGTIPNDIMAKRPVFHLLDSAIPPRQLRRFLPLSKAAGTGFFGFARPTAHLMKEGLLQEAADSGCLMLQLGVEGGSAALLGRYQKGIDPVESRAVIRMAAENGIRTYLYLLFGLPGETLADLTATRALLAEEAESIDFLNLSLFNLPRYCELAERAGEFDIRIGDFPGRDGEIRLYRPFTANGVDTRQQARSFLKSQITSDEKIRAAFLRTPRWLRAAHLSLMTLEGRRSPGGG